MFHGETQPGKDSSPKLCLWASETRSFIRCTSLGLLFGCAGGKERRAVVNGLVLNPLTPFVLWDPPWCPCKVRKTDGTQTHWVQRVCWSNINSVVFFWVWSWFLETICNLHLFLGQNDDCLGVGQEQCFGCPGIPMFGHGQICWWKQLGNHQTEKASTNRPYFCFITDSALEKVAKPYDFRGTSWWNPKGAAKDLLSGAGLKVGIPKSEDGRTLRDDDCMDAPPSNEKWRLCFLVI